MAFTLPALPYALDALAPHISKETLEFHHGKHHNAYVTKLNELVPGTKFENASLEEIILGAEGAIYNQGAQIWNHTFYWNCLKPNGGGKPTGELLKAIEATWGSFEKFKEEYTTKTVGIFGSGWSFLAKDNSGKLVITQEGAAGNPMKQGLKPLLTCDVWEHAYYIDFRNRRPDYLNAFWNLVNWDFVSKNFAG
ncbi:MAG: superoxide dismutase [Silvanigrellaceae bacterium]